MLSPITPDTLVPSEPSNSANQRHRRSQNWPFNVIQYWQQTSEPSPDDFVFL
jgi:4-hydroxyacetophenone monooxygenase